MYVVANLAEQGSCVFVQGCGEGSGDGSCAAWVMVVGMVNGEVARNHKISQETSRGGERYYTLPPFLLIRFP